VFRDSSYTLAQGDPNDQASVEEPAMTQRPAGTRFSRRSFISGAAGLAGLSVASTLLVACGAPAATPAPAQKPAEGGAAPAAAAPTTAAAPKAAAGQTLIKFHARQGAQEDELYKQRIPEFEAKFPNIKASLENFPGTEYYPKIATMAAGGTIGDAMWTSIGQGGVYFLYARKTIAPIDDYVANDKFDLKPYFPGCIKALTREGKLLGLPFKAHPGQALVFYNKKIFDDNGVKYPEEGWTTDDLVTIAKKVTKPDEYFGYYPTNGNNTQKGMLTATRTFGGELLSEDGKKSLINSKEAIDAIKFIYSLMRELKVSPAPDQMVGNTATPEQMFVIGKVAMFEGGTSIQVQQKVIGDKWTFSAVPNAKGPTGVSGSDYEVDAYSVVAPSKNKDQAWELVKWLTDQESGIRLGEIGGTIGGREDVYNAPRITKDPIRGIFAKVMANAMATRPVFNTRMEEYEKTMQQMLDPIWLGKEQPNKEYIDKVADSLQKILDKPLP
jgi:multiple sugar transport system substrate-binding protein